MLYAVEIEGRLYWVRIVEMYRTGPEVGKRDREPMAPESEAYWRTSGLLKILYR